jgi:hypothetical protein
MNEQSYPPWEDVGDIADPQEPHQVALLTTVAVAGL